MSEIDPAHQSDVCVASNVFLVKSYLRCKTQPTMHKHFPSLAIMVASGNINDCSYQIRGTALICDTYKDKCFEYLVLLVIDKVL